MIYKCKKNGHLWKKEDEAERCCNGWVPVIVPLFFDGLGEKPDFNFDPKHHSAFRYVLLPESEKELILELHSKFPASYFYPGGRKEAKEEGSWLQWNN